MALGTGNTIGTGTRTSSGSSTTITTSASTTAADVILIFCAKDNTGTGTANYGEFTTATDTAGNTYVKAGEWTNGGGADNAGATVALFYSKTDNNLATSSTITVNHDTDTDVALSAWKITTSGASYSFEIQTSATPVTVDGTAHGASIAISGLGSQEYLFARATSIEDEALTTDTATASYTAVTHLPSTTAGSNANNIFCAGEFLILTGTGSTSNPTYTTAASTQSATIFIAFKEVLSTQVANGLMMKGFGV